MRPLTVIVGAVSLAAVLSCTAEREPRAERVARPDTSAVTLQAAGAIDLRREPQEHFDRARTALFARNYLTSAAELRAATEFLREERAGAGHQGASLEEPASALDRLATRVASKVVKSAEELDSVFAAVHIAEAEYHSRRAAEAWTRRQARRTGEELLYAADHLERAAHDALRDLGAIESAAVERAREVSVYLLKGAGWSPGEVDQTIEMVRQGIDAYRSQLESRSPRNDR